jgi:hypothetical protein
VSFDARAASAATAHLRGLLESSDGEAEEAFLILENVLMDTVEKSKLDALRTAISEFDFEGALLKLNEITKEYGGDGEQEND